MHKPVYCWCFVVFSFLIRNEKGSRLKASLEKRTLGISHRLCVMCIQCSWIAYNKHTPSTRIKHTNTYTVMPACGFDFIQDQLNSNRPLHCAHVLSIFLSLFFNRLFAGFCFICYVCGNVYMFNVYSNRSIHVLLIVVLSWISSSSNRFEKESG